MYEQTVVASESLHQKTEVEIARLKASREAIVTMESDETTRGRWLDQLDQLIAEGNTLLNQDAILLDGGDWRRWKSSIALLEQKIHKAQDALPA